MIQAGKLRHLVQLGWPTRTVNDAGEAVVTFNPVNEINTWADIRPLRAWEIDRARQAQMQTTHRVIIRHRDDITPGWQVIWNGVVLTVTGIIPIDGRNEALELTCQQVTQP